MLITLSPSKGQDFEEASLSKKYTKPADLKDSELLIKELRKIKSKKLQQMMAISEKIAVIYSSPWWHLIPIRYTS